MNRVDDDWLLAMTQVEYAPPLRVISFFEREDNYDAWTGRRRTPIDTPVLRGAAEHPWKATVRLPRGMANDGWDWATISGRGVTPLDAMERCWVRLTGYLMAMSEINERMEQVE